MRIVEGLPARSLPRAFSITTPFIFGLFLLGIICCAGCGGNQKSADNSSSEAPSAPEKPAGPLLTLDPTTTGTISGAVTFSGTPPAPPNIDMAAAPPCLKLNPTHTAPTVVTGAGGGIQNVVVYLKSGLGNYHYDTPQAAAIIDQKGCMYVPRVVALMTNQPFEVQNDDPVLHNIHVVLKNSRSWTQSQTIGGPPIMATFMQPEFASRIVCNIHPWMRSYLFVFNNPYFAVTTSNGKFELKNIPPGTYTLETWQEKLGVQDQTITVGPKDSKTVSFQYSAGASGD
jgi:hypothetical protein